MAWNDGIATFTANGALTNKMRVKITAASTTTPPQVEVAGAGEQHIGITEYAAATGTLVAVKLRTYPGVHEGVASEALAVGATLYGAATGRIKDTSDGTAIGVAVEEATQAGDIIKFIDFTVISTTAATISVADTNSNMTGVTVEAVLNEIMAGLKGAQYLIQPASITLETGAPTVVFANAGADGFTQLTNKEVALRWNNGASPTKMAARFILPPDLNPAVDIVVHFLGAIIKAGANEADSPTITCEAYFTAVGGAMLVDANCGGTSEEFLTAGTDTWQEKTLTIATADVPTVASCLTLIFNPTDGQLGTDDFALAGVWIEATRKHLTS
jgi:hypothetical protein